MSTAAVEQGVLDPVNSARKAAAVAFGRIFIGIFWLFEVTVGHNWKIGGFGSDVHPGWVGAQAGDVIREDVAGAIADGTWAWFAWIYETIMVPNAVFWSYFTIGLQVALGIAFIIGFMVRPMALIGLTLDLSIFMLGNSRIPPFFAAMHIFLLVTGAGKFYGADGWLLDQLRNMRGRGARAARWLIELPILASRHRVPLLSAAALGALYLFLQIPARETTRFSLVAMELAALTGLLALGLHAARQIPSRFAIVAAGLRIFVGFKFLHEIWVRTDPGVNGLPGWAGAEAQRELFATIADNHWALFSWTADNIFIAAMPLWVVVFGAVQVAVGIALVLGWRTREMSLLGLAYLGGLIIMGMTRYAPFVFGLLVVALALDSGRVLSLDSVRRGGDLTPRYGLPLPSQAIPALIALAAVNATAAAVTAFQAGIAPDGYTSSMGAMTTAMVAILSGLLAFAGWIQRRPPAAVVLEESVATSEPKPATEAAPGPRSG